MNRRSRTPRWDSGCRPTVAATLEARWMRLGGDTSGCRPGCAGGRGAEPWEAPMPGHACMGAGRRQGTRTLPARLDNRCTGILDRRWPRPSPVTPKTGRGSGDRRGTVPNDPSSRRCGDTQTDVGVAKDLPRCRRPEHPQSQDRRVLPCVPATVRPPSGGGTTVQLLVLGGVQLGSSSAAFAHIGFSQATPGTGAAVDGAWCQGLEDSGGSDVGSPAVSVDGDRSGRQWSRLTFTVVKAAADVTRMAERPATAART